MGGVGLEALHQRESLHGPATGLRWRFRKEDERRLGALLQGVSNFLLPDSCTGNGGLTWNSSRLVWGDGRGDGVILKDSRVAIEWDVGKQDPCLGRCRWRTDSQPLQRRESNGIRWRGIWSCE